MTEDSRAIEPVYLKVAKNLKRIRQNSGKTQLDVSKAMKANRVYYTLIENGKARYALHRLDIICQFLEIEIQEVLK